MAICGVIIVCGLTAGTWYYVTPKYTRVGYQPIQPVPFPHDVHVSQLGMDCRYCHSFVDVAAHSNLPNTQTCMNCHSQVQKDNPKLEPVRASWKTGNPIEWVQLHRTPDYVFYNHSAHVNRGISCFSCHGPVNHMPVVYHAKPHSMKWCLECHREPDQHLRDPALVTTLGWGIGMTQGQHEEIARAYHLNLNDELNLSDKDKQVIGEFWRHHNNLKPSQDCSTCHR